MKRPNEFHMLVLFTIIVCAAIMLYYIVPIFWRNL